MSAKSRNGNPATSVAELAQAVLHEATAIVSDIFAPAIPAGWGAAWLEVFERFKEQESRVRELVSGFSRNREAMRAHWETIASFLKEQGVDPEQPLESDFGAFMDLSPTASWLADVYRPESERQNGGRKISLPMTGAKAAHRRWGFLPSATWSGFLIHHFESFSNPVYVHPNDAFEPRREAPQRLYPSDSELAAISIVIFHAKFSGLGVALVTPDDLRSRASASKVLAAHRRLVTRAHLDIEKARDEISWYEGDELPPKADRGITRTRYRPALPWPSRRAGKSFEELVRLLA